MKKWEIHDNLPKGNLTFCHYPIPAARQNGILPPKKEKMMRIFDWATVPGHPVRPGVTRKAFTGEGALLLITELGPGSVESPHTHPFEQLVFVLEGDVEFTLGDEKRAVSAGSVFRIPPGTPHGASARGEKRCHILAVYGPPRPDCLPLCDYQKE